MQMESWLALSKNVVQVWNNKISLLQFALKGTRGGFVHFRAYAIDFKIKSSNVNPKKEKWFDLTFFYYYYYLFLCFLVLFCWERKSEGERF